MRLWKIYTILISLVAAASLLINAILLQNRSTPTSATFLVSDVIDGDTFTIKAGIETRRVRLIGVNAPELEKCLGEEAKNKLSKLLSDREVTLEDQFLDPYGRIMANVYVGDKYINKAILESGLGRMDYYENPQKEALKKAYADARAKKIGIFSQMCLSLTPPISSETGDVCGVKGNIDTNTQKKYYFLPACRNYSQVTIDLSTDDQWFCSESEAIQAGFTKSKTCV